MEKKEAPCSDLGDLVIDMTLSDDEEPTTQTEKANEIVDPLMPTLSLDVPEVAADVPNELAASSMPQDPLQIQNPILGSDEATSTPSGALVPLQCPAAQITDPNLLGILGSYTPSELARVTTQAMIECIEKFPALWDSQEPSFHNHKYCTLLWKNIAGVLNMSVKKAKSKWYSLKSAYRKEFAKSRASGIKSRFTYFQALSFLETETLREKQRGYNEKTKLVKLLKRNNLQDSIPVSNNSSEPDPNGMCSVDLDDDDCMIVENLEDCSEGSTPNADHSLVLSAPSPLISKDMDSPDSSHLTQKAVATNGTASINEIASANKQPRSSIVIRAKNISELMAVPPPVPFEAASNHDIRTRSPSPEVVFLNEKAQTISKVTDIVVSDAFPNVSTNELPSNQSFCDSSKSNPVHEMKSTVAKIVNRKSITSKKKSSIRKKENMLNGSIRDADLTAQKFLKGSPALSTSEHPKTGNASSGPSKKLNGTVLGKRASEIAPSSSTLIKKPKLSKSESTKGSNRPRDPQESTDMNRGFLMSLLPDVEGMTNAQFRTFKKQATALVSMILDR